MDAGFEILNITLSKGAIIGKDEQSLNLTYRQYYDQSDTELR